MTITWYSWNLSPAPSSILATVLFNRSRGSGWVRFRKLLLFGFQLNVSTSSTLQASQCDFFKTVPSSLRIRSAQPIEIARYLNKNHPVMSSQVLSILAKRRGVGWWWPLRCTWFLYSDYARIPGVIKAFVVSLCSPLSHWASYTRFTLHSIIFRQNTGARKARFIIFHTSAPPRGRASGVNVFGD